MEIRVLKNFLVIAYENNISKAAEILHISQSALSRQIMDLEEELGTKLFNRSYRSFDLTLDGLRFRERAQSIVDLSDKTVFEFTHREEELYGEVGIAIENSFETEVLSKTLFSMHDKYPNVKFSFIDSATEASIHFLEEGIIDFAVLTEPFDREKFDYIILEKKKSMGVLMRNDDQFSSKEKIEAADLKKMKLIVFHGFIKPHFPKRPAISRGTLDMVANYTSLHTIIPLIKDGLGNALCLREDSEQFVNEGLIFLPIDPPIDFEVVLAYRKNHILSKQAEAFLKEFRIQEDLRKSTYV